MLKTSLILALIILLPRGERPVYAGSIDDYDYETVTIHTDRDVYIAGERLYFRLDIFSGADRASGLAYVALRSRENETVLTLCADINENTGHGSIYLPDTLSSAPYQLVAFTNWMRNWDDKYYATKQLLIVNRFDDGTDLQALLEQSAGMEDACITVSGSGSGIPGGISARREDAPVQIDIPAGEFGTRERVRIILNAELPAGSPITLSVSVAQKQSLFKSFHEELFFRKPTSSVPDRGHSFFRETGGPVLSGSVRDRISGEPIEAATVLLNTPDTVLNLLYARTLPGGDFHFLLDHYHEGKDLYLSLYGNDKHIDASLEMNDKFALEDSFEPAPVQVAEGFDQFLKASRDIVTVKKVFGTDHNRYIEVEKSGYPPKVYSKPSLYFDMFDEYVHFNDLQDIARELIPTLRIRRQRDGLFRSSLLLEHEEFMVVETPEYFLDGIYVDDVNRILHLDSRILSKMEIQNHIWHHGNIKFTGIVAFFSTSNEYRNIKLNSSSISFSQSPINRGSSHTPPVYSSNGTGKTPMPDFRQLLFWEPSVTLDNSENSAAIEFYTGDIKGEFVIRLRGVSSDGTIINERAEITIK